MPAIPAAAENLFFEGNQHMAAGDAAAARHCFRQAIALAPDFAQALANLGLLHERDGALEQAQACYRQAIALWPEDGPEGAQVYLNLGVLLLKEKKFEEAESLLRQALQMAPQSPAAWSNLGVLLACLQREAEAEQCYRTALALDPGFHKASFNLAYILLRQGRLREGWSCLDARLTYAPLLRYFSCPRWHGEDISGKKIIIGFEGGHGDMIQFCRYASELKARGAAQVAILCDPALARLFATLPGIDAVYPHNAAAPTAGWDFWTLPLSLPLHCKTELPTIPRSIPYLRAAREDLSHWAPRLGAPGLRVGLAWQGNRHFENDGERSLASLAPLTPLASVAGLRFVSLQKGDSQLPPALREPFDLLTLGDSFGDFADTAAVIAQLDLVISVDTAIVHLSGALGTPCWVLLPAYRTDWRWMSKRSDTPWYADSMRLFRQDLDGDWTTVIARLRTALADWARR